MVCRKPIGLREVQIIQRMRRILAMTITQIALAVDRSRTTVYRALDISPNRTSMPRRGRRSALTKKQVRHVVSALRAMVKKAGARYEITLPMVMKRARVKCSDKTLRKALAKKGVKFRKLRTKPLLTKADRRERLAFARKYKDKPTTFWLKSVHMHIDCKTFPAYVTARGRLYAAMREVRGAYRQKCEGLADGYVVQPKEMRFNPGCKAVKIIAGVGDGQLMMWRDYGSRWSGQTAARVYKGPMAAALRAAKPRLRNYSVLEDNDPTGFKSTQGEAAKRKAHIKPFCIPKRSCVASSGALSAPCPAGVRRSLDEGPTLLRWGGGVRVSRAFEADSIRLGGPGPRRCNVRGPPT